MISETFHLDHKLESIDPMVQLLTRAVGDVLPSEVQGRFGICSAEALTNLVLHAQNCAPDAKIKIVLTETDLAVQLEVYDPEGADPFDLRDYAQDVATIDVMAEGGRGLGLIMACADHVTYGPVTGKNRLKMTFNK